MSDALLNTGLIATYVLLGLAAIAAVGFSIAHLILNFKKAKGALIGMAILLIIFLIGFSFATSEVYAHVAIPVGESASRIIGGGIHTTFILIGLAIVAAVFTEVSKLFR
ncbi:MAG: hypothetical protein EA393_16145 [Bacteroidetes bacterium]|nr:MAG: hypothetical protein EA393_16145 [Bacteroidota bacterium]